MSSHQIRMLPQEASALLKRINDARSSAYIAPLTPRNALQTLAETHASSLADTRALCPISLNLKLPYGENLHQCGSSRPSVDAFTAWNNNKCARDNIFSAHAKYVGVAVASVDGLAFVVMFFTKQDPDELLMSDLGSVGSCTTKRTVSQVETDAVTRTEWPVENDRSEKDNGKLVEKDRSEKENKNPVDENRLPVSKALDIAHDAFNFMNGSRRDVGVHYLKWDEGLYEQALAHSERIFRVERLLHSAKRRFENVAVLEHASLKNPGKELSGKLMRRRENMLSSSFEYCAIAVVGDHNKVYATQLFSRERVP